MDARAVLFDLDGTLVDSLPGIQFSIDISLAECGVPARSRELRPLIGPPIRTILEQVVPGADQQQLAKLEHAFRHSYNSSGWRKTVLHERAAETLGRLKAAGLPLYLVTNKPQAPTERIIAALEIAPFFDEVTCRDSRTPPYESKAEMIEQVLSRHGLDAEACVYVGDSLEDHRAATEAGVPVALVAHGYGELDPELKGCTHLKGLSEVLNIAGIMEIA